MCCIASAQSFVCSLLIYLDALLRSVAPCRTVPRGSLLVSASLCVAWLGLVVLLSVDAGVVAAASASGGRQAWSSQAFLILSCIFLIGFFRSWLRSARARHTLKGQILATCHSLEQLRDAAAQAGRPLIRFAILVPARGESRVIANTMIHLSAIHYDCRYLDVYVIADSREQATHGEPATATIAMDWADRLNRSLGRPVFHVLQVPDDYDGRQLTAGAPSLASSKGRALNYALEHLQAVARLPDLIGVLDADGRLHPDVLLEAGWRHLVHGSLVLQGPVFQISNLDRVDLFGVMAGIELSIYHLSCLATQLHSRRFYPRFLAGTNYFICPHRLLAAGGWRSQALVEDADLGLRLFLGQRLRADWLPCPELEQTAPSLSVYLKQRHRWALGHLQLLPQIHQASLHGFAKLRLYWQVLRFLVSSPLTVVLPLLGWALVLFQPPPFTASWPAALSLLLFLLSLYTWDDFGRGLRLLNLQAPRPLCWWRVLAISLALMALMPCLMVVQLIPRLRALCDFLFSSRVRLQQVAWYKTERSIEDVGC